MTIRKKTPPKRLNRNKSEGEFAYLSFSIAIFLAPVLPQEFVGLSPDKLLGIAVVGYPGWGVIP
jgi:hypothetical protein